ncbi:MAG: tetratricopeptide repeat protein [Bacteroidales bacterium]|nr:tetratricopeptide repeat protein [Bacteroidales bacterium]
MKRLLFVVLFFFLAISSFSQVDIRKNATAFSKGIECKYQEDVQGAIKHFEEALKFMPDDAASMFELSEQYVKAGRVDDGFAMIKQAAELDPENKWYQMRLAMFYRTMQQFDEYAAIYEKLTAKYPDDVEMLSDLIDAYLITENYDKAIEKLNLLEKQAGISAMVSEQKVEIYKRQGNTKKVISELERLIAENPESTRYYNMLAKVYMENKKEKEAIKLYNQIKAIDPTDPYINISLLEYYEKSNEPEKAFDELIEAINNKNLDFNTKANIYDYWFNKHQDGKDIDQQAFRAGNAFLENYPDNKMGYLVLASYYINKKAYQPCKEMAKQALKYDRGNYSAWQYLVLSEGPLGETDSLKTHSIEALQFFPMQPLFYWFAGVACALEKQDREAIGYFEKGRKFVTDKAALVDFDSYLGDLYHSVGEPEKAFLAYDRVLSQDPDNVLVLNNYAYYLSLRKENLDKAKDMSLRAVELEPNNAIYLDTYAWVLYQKGEYTAAEAQMEKAIKLLNKPDQTYYQHYADILMKVNKPDQAEIYRNKAKALKDGQ